MTDESRTSERCEPEVLVDREGGDAACWAHRVCQECGRLNDAEHPVTCENCGARFE